jgi:hypothetical protein
VIVATAAVVDVVSCRVLLCFGMPSICSCIDRTWRPWWPPPRWRCREGCLESHHQAWSACEGKKNRFARAHLLVLHAHQRVPDH